MTFYNTTPTNGFDSENLDNARQNNYAWSIGELDEYVYVGTGRNIPHNIIKSIQGAKAPTLISPKKLDNLPEIWRYKKNDSMEWQRVYKAPVRSKITGYRFIIGHRPAGGTMCLYAASYGNGVQILKTTNGVNWFKVQEGKLKGSSSRAMITHKDKLYIATIDETSLSSKPLLYSSKDPEFYPFKLVIDDRASGFDPDKNPKGQISNMTVFNNKLYVATSGIRGVELWRTEGEEPEMNKWVMVADKGFNNPLNSYSLSIGVFKEHLYLSLTKALPLSWFIPIGCEIVRVNKSDKWDLIVGGGILDSLDKDKPIETGLSGYGPGFSNPFNVYGWQIQEYKGKLLITTFDDATNMELILNGILANRPAIESLIGQANTKIIIEIYELIVRELGENHYPFGFDMYISDNGVNFYPAINNGMCNKQNYGGRLLFVDSCDSLYIGTANPFEGCEVWKTDQVCRCYSSDYNIDKTSHIDIHKKINEHWDVLKENMPMIIDKFFKKE